MKRYDMYQDYDMLVKPEEHVRGEWVYYDDAQATIARLTTERDRARAETAAAYERAAEVIEGMPSILENADVVLTFDFTPLAAEIRSLATEADTAALAEMLDSETRACIEASSNAAAGYRERQFASKGIEARDWEGMKLAALFIRDLLTARLDQRKEAGK